MEARTRHLKMDWLSLAIGGFAILVGMLVGVVVLNVDNMLKFLAIVGGMAVLIGTIMTTEWGLVFLVFMTYVRLSDILVAYHGLPSIAQPYIMLILALILVRWSTSRRAPHGWERAAVLLFAYGLVIFSSLLYAANFDRAWGAVTDYFKDGLIAIVITVLLKRRDHLRQAIFSLIFAAGFMASITAFQYITGTFSDTYLGFGQATVMNIVTGYYENRISGPVGDPNFYSQILVFVIPLAIDRLLNERVLWLRAASGWSLLVSLLSVVFTFSRGGFVGLVIVFGFILLRYVHRPVLILTLMILMVVGLQFAPDVYIDRMATIPDALAGVQNPAAEASLRGRTSEIVAAWMMLMDYPVLGVGVNNYAVNYQTYSRKLGLDIRRGYRSAHNMYLQVAAETGLVGIGIFMYLLWTMYTSIRKTQRFFRDENFADEASIVGAYMIGFASFLATSIFLHLAYTRYFYLIFGIALGMPNIIKTIQDEREMKKLAKSYDVV